MQYISSFNDISQFDKIMAMIKQEPVTIQRQGQDAVIMVSPEEYRRITRNNVEDLLSFCDEVGTNAQAKGMTEEVLDDILSEYDEERRARYEYPDQPPAF